MNIEALEKFQSELNDVSGTYELFEEHTIANSDLKEFHKNLKFHDYGPSGCENYAKLVVKNKDGKDKKLNMTFKYRG